MENLLILMGLTFMESELNLKSTLSEEEKDIAIKIVREKFELNNFIYVEYAHELISVLIRDYYTKSIKG